MQSQLHHVHYFLDLFHPAGSVRAEAKDANAMKAYRRMTRSNPGLKVEHGFKVSLKTIGTKTFFCSKFHSKIVVHYHILARYCKGELYPISASLGLQAKPRTIVPDILSCLGWVDTPEFDGLLELVPLLKELVKKLWQSSIGGIDPFPTTPLVLGKTAAQEEGKQTEEKEERKEKLKPVLNWCVDVVVLSSVPSVSFPSPVDDLQLMKLEFEQWKPLMAKALQPIVRRSVKRNTETANLVDCDTDRALVRCKFE